jgi:hypothetical protein
MATPVYRWNDAVFVAFGDVPWTEDDAAAFVTRVQEVAVEERARAAMKEEAAHVDG